MATSIRKLTKMGGDVRQIAKLLQAKGRNGDSILAHITPKEAALLKSKGGAGTINPETGLQEFYGEDFFTDYEIPEQYTPQASYSNEGYAGAQPTAESLGMSPVDFRSMNLMGIQSPEEYNKEAQNAANIQAMSPVDASSMTKLGFKTPEEYYNWAGIAPVQQTGTPPLPPGIASDAAVFPTATPATTTPSQVTTPAAKDAGFLDALAKALGTNMGGLAVRGGLGAAQTVMAAQQAKAAQAQADQAKQEQQKLAAPYQTAGSEMQQKAQRGELTPQGQQTLEAARAQAAQGAEARGGVGAQQVQAQVEALRQNLLQQQYDYGVKLSGIGDQIALGAIKSGIQADQYVQQLTSSYMNNIARTIFGTPPTAAAQVATAGSATPGGQ